MSSFLALRRLRVMKSGQAAYDERFHLGTNIIRGENGSGKSTISDFIFFALGGEFDAWKDAARLCDEVQAEIQTASAIITVKRSTESRQAAAFVFFGNMDDASASGIDGWERFPIRRGAEAGLSFSQVLFKSCGIPEASNDAGSNITMHQILRLMYSDQQTPAGKLFRFESFDTKDIRQAVGDLLIGVNSYQLYETQITLRQLVGEYQAKDRLYSAALAALPSSEGLSNVASLNARILEIRNEIAAMQQKVEQVDAIVNSGETDDFIAAREGMRKILKKASVSLNQQERLATAIDFEIDEIEAFLSYLEELLAKIGSASSLAVLLGELEFRYCPSCLKPLPDHGDGNCVVCGTIIDEEGQRSKYLELKIDNELQIKETRQLLSSKLAERDELTSAIRKTRKEFKEQLTEFTNRYDSGNSPREAFLATQNRQMGALERECEHLEELREALLRLDTLSAERAALNDRIGALEALSKRLFAASNARTVKAMAVISGIGRGLLMQDLPRQDEFENPRTFSIDFADDAIMVDGKMNFAESSNVIAKNTAILSLFSAASLDNDFWHPKFLLLDNVEDKGMEMQRSHNFQRLIVERSKAAVFPHQIIFTTSMMNPDLELDELTVGPSYTRANKALKIDN